ncbi:MAG: anti-sigma factor [Flavobacteriaceae bacterium]|nr:anti-sigma factor [Flavobacteriaceae bacterium]
MKKIIFIAIMALGIIFVACDDDDVVMTTKNLTLSIDGLENLGSAYVYEGWIIVDNKPQSTGRFSVDDEGKLSRELFVINKIELAVATAFILTIEPALGDDPAPSSVHLLAGNFSGNTGNLTIDHGLAIGNDFNTAAGSYILATPTDGSMNNENSGIWFLSIESMSPVAGLMLPLLPDGWVYEGWAVIDGVPVSTGTFSMNTGKDSFDGYSSQMYEGPPFPGEDFLMNPPDGLTFPTDLAGGKAVISIEPVPDTNPGPFLLKPLVGMIPTDAEDHKSYLLGKNLNFPVGTVSR